MRNFKLMLLAILTIMFSITINAQTPKTADLEIKTSAQCGMCKETIEKAMAFEKGVVKADLVVETKILKVTYKTARTNPETIRKAVSAAGYDADEVAADPKAYANLSNCCKKPEDREPGNSGHQH